MLNLSVKERMLLEDEKEHEKLCVNKYNESANKAHDPELKTLFSQLAQKEQEHLNSINQMLSGSVPPLPQGMQQQQQQIPNGMNLNQIPTIAYDEDDKMLCSDALSTEKFVSSTYNTAIFEFRDTNARQFLNHIQKEEQEHGEKLYNYMASHGMYQVQ